MSLLNEIRTAQRDAGEAVVIANLQRQGLIPPEPPPMYPQGIINQLEGEAKVLRDLLRETTDVIDTLIDDDDDSEGTGLLAALKARCIAAIVGVPA